MQQKPWMKTLLICTTLLFSIQLHATEIVINKFVGQKEQLSADVLALILSKVEPQATIRQNAEKLQKSRLIEEIKSKKIDVMWAGVSPDLEEQLLPIRIPILKGLLGHRIFIIKKGQQARFDNIKTLSDLKKLTAGQGTTWGDTVILKSAKIPVVTTLKYNNLFYMLEGGRFDYFPRAIHEPWSEVKKHSDLNLVVEKKILLIYPFAMNFFVRKDNQALHDKLYKGFEMAIADGSFDQLFFNNPLIKDALQKTNIKNRTIIRAPNPTLNPDTPIDRKEFWLDPTSL